MLSTIAHGIFIMMVRMPDEIRSIQWFGRPDEMGVRHRSVLGTLGFDIGRIACHGELDALKDGVKGGVKVRRVAEQKCSARSMIGPA